MCEAPFLSLSVLHRTENSIKILFLYVPGCVNFSDAPQKNSHMPATANNLSHWQGILSITDSSYCLLTDLTKKQSLTASASTYKGTGATHIKSRF